MITVKGVVNTLMISIMYQKKVKDGDEQIRDWIETWYYDNDGELTPEVMANTLDIGWFEAKDWIER